MSGNNVVAISTVYHHGTTYLPAKIRAYLEITDGDTVHYIQDFDGGIRIVKGGKLSDLRKKLGKYV